MRGRKAYEGNYVYYKGYNYNRVGGTDDPPNKTKEGKENTSQPGLGILAGITGLAGLAGYKMLKDD